MLRKSHQAKNGRAASTLDSRGLTELFSRNWSIFSQMVLCNVFNMLSLTTGRRVSPTENFDDFSIFIDDPRSHFPLEGVLRIFARLCDVHVLLNQPSGKLAIKLASELAKRQPDVTIWHSAGAKVCCLRYVESSAGE